MHADNEVIDIAMIRACQKSVGFSKYDKIVEKVVNAK
jgi:hypothetical protein